MGLIDAIRGVRGGYRLRRRPEQVVLMKIVRLFDKYAPDLTRAFPRIGEDAIHRRLEKPEVAFADSYRKMPQQHLTFFYLAIPRIKGFPDGDYDEKSGHFGFWTASLGIVGMSLAFGVAGVWQAYLERAQGQPYMVAQLPIRFWMSVVAAHGLIVLVGVVVTVRHLLTLKPGGVRQAAAAN